MWWNLAAQLITESAGTLAYRRGLVKLVLEPVHSLIPRPEGRGGDCGGTVVSYL